MNLENLRSMVDSLQQDLLQTLETLVRCESPSTDKAAADVYAGLLAARFAKLDLEVSLVDNSINGAQVRVVSPNKEGAEKPGLLLCHYDTVWPLGTLNGMPFRVEGDKAFGPGIYDMKASHAMIEFALRAIKALDLPLPRPLEMLFTSDEEIGSVTSRPLIEERAREAAYVLVLEPPTAAGALKTARKGVGDFDLQVRGRAAHAGSQPELGISAINELAHQVLAVQALADLEKGTTINTGVVHGGTRSNVIAAQAEAQIDVRVWTPEEAERITQAMNALKPTTAGALLTVDGGFERPPMVRSQGIIDLFQKVKEVGQQLGLELDEGSTGGGSDGNFTAALGIPTLDGLGAVGDGAHGDHEHILISELAPRTTLLAAAILTL
jgi:glutamate carboxypeptidase